MKHVAKILKSLIVLSMFVLLVGCGAQDSDTSEQEGQDYTTGTPWMDIDIEGVVTADTPTDLKDNFALAVNKDKILDLEIPEGYSYAGTVMDVVLENADDLKNMFLSGKAESHDAKQAMTLFNLMMDWDGRNEAGVTPLKEKVDAIEALDSIDDLNTYLSEIPTEERLSSLWSAGSGEDLEDSTKYVLTVSTPDLLLDDSAEYETLTDYGKTKKEARSELAQKMLVKLGYSEEEAAAKVENCLDFETKLAEGICTNEEQNQSDYLSKINNHYTREEFIAEQKNLPLLETLEKSKGYPEADDYVITEPAFVERLNELYTEDELTAIKDYLIVHGTIDEAGILDRECYEWYNDARNAIRGSTGMLEDATVFSDWTADTLAWPVAQLYTETYLKAEDKERISEMIDEILAEYRGIIEGADFLSDATREKALEKLGTVSKNVLYPDSWEEYSYEGLDLVAPEDGGTLAGAMARIEAYENEKDKQDYMKPVDKEKWVQPPHIINCFYYPLNNGIYIMGAFARGNIYNNEMSDEELYAKLGAVIGHEISHAFDSSGAQFDKDGNMSNWWEEEDMAAFEERNKKMEEYYNSIHPWEGQDLYGSALTGEACADMAGVKCMLLIAEKKKDFDYDKFFRSYADLWLTKETLQRTYSGINDTHPLNYLRINVTLQQYDEFLDCYGITEGDNMYLAPEDRINIW